MKVILTKRTGFCFGVKRAVNIAETALKTNKSIASLGSIIHNRQVVECLSRKGLRVIKDKDKIKTTEAVIISSHGLSPKITDGISKRGIKIIDTTCPFVLNAQMIAQSLSKSGYECIIVGEREHPEVKALMDFLSSRVHVVKDKLEAEGLKLRPNEKIGIISQTTQSTDNFLDCVKIILKKKPKEVRIFNTICRDVEERQDAARRLAEKVDVMLVIGGKDSANTRRLYEVCRQISNHSYLIETENDIESQWFKKGYTIGITSGASTPDWVVERVVERVNSSRQSKSTLNNRRCDGGQKRGLYN